MIKNRKRYSCIKVNKTAPHHHRIWAIYDNKENKFFTRMPIVFTDAIEIANALNNVDEKLNIIFP